MDLIKQITAAISGGEIQPTFDAKAFKNLAKAYQKLGEARVAKLYPVRRFYVNESFYTVYAFSFRGGEITDDRLAQIRETVSTLDYSSMRYDGVQMNGMDYWCLDPETGRHLDLDRNYTSVAAVSDAFDGVVLYTHSCFSSYKKSALKHNAEYVLLGLKKAPNQFGEPIEIRRTDLGLPFIEPVYEGYDPNASTDASQDEGEAEIPSRYQLATQVVSALIVIGLLIYYFLIKK